jgi:hypothetical protein
MSVAFIDCPPERIGDLRSFFAEMYSSSYVLSADERFLRWQFGPTPASRRSDYHLILGVVDGQIKGCIGYIPTELSVAGQVRSCAWAANWMVDDSIRRLGLGPLLIRELAKRFDVTLALGGNRDAHDLLPRMGWTDFGCLRLYVRVLDSESAALLTGAETLAWPSRPVVAKAANGSVRSVAAFDDDATRVWDGTWGQGGSGTRRSAEFLNWRYASHPVFRHRLYECRDGGRLVAIAVARLENVRDMPVRIGRLLELVGDDIHLAGLVGAVVEDMRSERVAAIDFFCASRRFEPVLQAVGFLSGDDPPARDIPILFQPIDRTRSGILFMANLKRAPDAAAVDDWYVTKSDGDQDRPA